MYRHKCYTVYDSRCVCSDDTSEEEYKSWLAWFIQHSWPLHSLITCAIVTTYILCVLELENNHLAIEFGYVLYGNNKNRNIEKKVSSWSLRTNAKRPVCSEYGRTYLQKKYNNNNWVCLGMTSVGNWDFLDLSLPYAILFMSIWDDRLTILLSGYSVNSRSHPKNFYSILSFFSRPQKIIENLSVPQFPPSSPPTSPSLTNIPTYAKSTYWISKSRKIITANINMCLPTLYPPFVARYFF